MGKATWLFAQKDINSKLRPKTNASIGDIGQMVLISFVSGFIIHSFQNIFPIATFNYFFKSIQPQRIMHRETLKKQNESLGLFATLPEELIIPLIRLSADSTKGPLTGCAMLALFSGLSKEWYVRIQKLSKNQTFISTCEADGICMKPELIFYPLTLLGGNPVSEFFKNGIYSYNEYQRQNKSIGYAWHGKIASLNDRIHFHCMFVGLSAKGMFRDGIFVDEQGPSLIAVWVNPKTTLVHNFRLAARLHLQTSGDDDDYFEQSAMTLTRYIEQKKKGLAMEDAMKDKKAEEYKFVWYNCLTAEPAYAHTPSPNAWGEYVSLISLESPVVAARIVKKVPDWIYEPVISAEKAAPKGF